MKDIIETLSPYWPILGLMGLALLIALIAAYLLGEWRGSQHTYEPLPAEYLPERAEPDDEALYQVAEEIVTTASISVITTDVEEIANQTELANHHEALAARYRRDALVATKRAQAALEMLTQPRRPSKKALESATVEVKGREVPLIPKGHS